MNNTNLFLLCITHKRLKLFAHCFPYNNNFVEVCICIFYRIYVEVIFCGGFLVHIIMHPDILRAGQPAEKLHNMLFIACKVNRMVKADCRKASSELTLINAVECFLGCFCADIHIIKHLKNCLFDIQIFRTLHRYIFNTRLELINKQLIRVRFSRIECENIISFVSIKTVNEILKCGGHSVFLQNTCINQHIFLVVMIISTVNQLHFR